MPDRDLNAELVQFLGVVAAMDGRRLDGMLCEWGRRLQREVRELVRPMLVFRPTGGGFELGVDGGPLLRLVPGSRQASGLVVLHRVAAAHGRPLTAAELGVQSPRAAYMRAHRAGTWLQHNGAALVGSALVDGLHFGASGVWWTLDLREHRVRGIRFV